MEMTTKYAKAKAEKESKSDKPKFCSSTGCSGLPVFNGMCVFHAACGLDFYLKGAMTIVLRNHPNYHRLLNYARLCTHYDPPRTNEEWKIVHSCAQLLNRVELLPNGFDLSDDALFKDAMLGNEKIVTDSGRFCPTWIGMRLEELTVQRVVEEARKVLASSKDRESLLSSADREEMLKRRKYHKEDFVEFGNLPMFQPKKEAA